MRLRTFYVKSYRSIIEATLEDIQKYCAIVGPNNSGKSNLLRAIYIALSIALEGDFRRTRRSRQFYYTYSGEGYRWETDIPVTLRDVKDASTVFKLTFEFNDAEKAEFKEKFGIALSKSLQMKFQLFETRTEYNIIMPGRAKKPMEEKMREIGLFIRSKLDYEYIPCVRSTDLTAEYFARLLNKEFSTIENNPIYQECLRKIEELQKPIVDALEAKLASSLRTFLPDIASVKLQDGIDIIDTQIRYAPSRMRGIPLNIDDGSLTPIESKGDGIKNLVAIGLIESMSFDNLQDKSLILCIEEPEAHLHPDAIHSLRNVLLEIAEKKGVQVIISTHSPILVDRNDVSNNVVVSPGHRVYPCKSIENVREVLGVRLTDNLSASKVVLVEGESDKRYIEAICRSIAPDVMSKIVNSTLRIESVNSATKMDFQIRLYNSLAVSTLVVLDMDDSGIAAYEQLLSRKTKPASEILQIKSAGMTRCELEDIVKFDAYATIIKDEFNISVDTKAFKDRRKPWSDRLHQAASKSPGVFDDRIEAQIKTRIANIVVEKGIDAIADYDREYIQNLVEAISRFAG